LPRRPLSAHTDALADRVEPRPKQAVIAVPESMDQDAVVKRHLKLFPQDRRAELIVVVRTFLEADPDAPYGEHENPRTSRAWREIARERAPLIFTGENSPYRALSENSMDVVSKHLDGERFGNDAAVVSKCGAGAPTRGCRAATHLNLWSAFPGIRQRAAGQ